MSECKCGKPVFFYNTVCDECRRKKALEQPKRAYSDRYIPYTTENILVDLFKEDEEE